MELHVYNQYAFAYLQKYAEQKAAVYNLDTPWFAEIYTKNNPNAKMYDDHFQMKEIPDFHFLMDKKSIKKSDAENAIIIHSALRNVIKRNIAANSRFWACLSHQNEECYQYTKLRFGIKDINPEGISKTDLQNKTKRFFSKIEDDWGLRQDHALSRLYWAAELTYDDSYDEPYTLTRYAFLNQMAFNNFVLSENSKSFNKMKGMLLALNDVYRKRSELKHKASFGTIFSAGIRKMNLYSCGKLPDILDYQFIQEKMIGFYYEALEEYEKSGYIEPELF